MHWINDQTLICVQPFSKSTFPYPHYPQDGVADDGSLVTVAERKLRVGIHNGWRFVQSPHTVFLERDYAQQSPAKKGARMKSSMRMGANNSADSKEEMFL